MATDIWLTKDDTSPAYETVLRDSEENPVDITGSSVAVLMNDYEGNVKINDTASIEDGAGGVVKYIWKPADTDTAGFFKFVFQVTYPDGSIETFPNYKYLEVQIDEVL